MKLIPKIPMKWQLLIAGFCTAVLFFGLTVIRPHMNIILDILLIPCIIFGCYFGYNIITLKKKLKEVED